MEENRLMVAIFFPEEVINDIAEEKSIPTRLIEFNDTAPFMSGAKSMFERFNSRQKHTVFLSLLEEEMDLKYYNKVGIVTDSMPIHNQNRKGVKQIWNKY